MAEAMARAGFHYSARLDANCLFCMADDGDAEEPATIAASEADGKARATEGVSPGIGILHRLENVLDSKNAAGNLSQPEIYVFATRAPAAVEEGGVVISVQSDAAFWWQMSRLEDIAAACGFDLETASCADGDLSTARAIPAALEKMAGCQADLYDLACAGQSEEEWLLMIESLLCPGGRSLELTNLECVTALSKDWPYD